MVGQCLILLLLMAQAAPGAHATAERCHAVDSDTGFSCMECSECTHCYPGDLCDVQCQDCGPCYFFPDADGCDACEICMPCKSCMDCPQSCADDCIGCAPYQKMLDCQNGSCKDCAPCYADMTAPGCDACAPCADCANCDVMPDCHDCRCCKGAGCTLCEGEEEECPEGGYTPEQLAETWTPPPAETASIGRKSNKAVQVLVIVAVMAVVALVVSNLNLVSGSLVKSDREESASLLREETAGKSYQSVGGPEVPSPRVMPARPPAGTDVTDGV